MSLYKNDNIHIKAIDKNKNVYKYITYISRFSYIIFAYMIYRIGKDVSVLLALYLALNLLNNILDFVRSSLRDSSIMEVLTSQAKSIKTNTSLIRQAFDKGKSIKDFINRNK